MVRGVDRGKVATGEPTERYYLVCLITPITVDDFIAVGAPDVFDTATTVLHTKRHS